MDNKEKEVLFNALGQILYNQQKIMRHLGINKLDSQWGWVDEVTSLYADDCCSIVTALQCDENDE